MFTLPGSEAGVEAEVAFGSFVVVAVVSFVCGSALVAVAGVAGCPVGVVVGLVVVLEGSECGE